MEKIIISLLFPIVGLSSCIAAAPEWDGDQEFVGHVDIIRGLHADGIIDDNGMSLLILQARYQNGNIDQLEFLRQSIDLLKDGAMRNLGLLGLMNMLCRQCGLERRSALFVQIFSSCLTNPDLRDTPLLVLDIAEDYRDKISVGQSPYANPDPEFCRAVMDTADTGAMADVFNTFFTNKQRRRSDHRYDAQADIYDRATTFRVDLPRSKLELEIGGRRFFISDTCKGTLRGTKGSIPTREAFDALLEDIKDQAGLEDEDAFEIVKQIALAFRGQNGCKDSVWLLFHPLTDKIDMDSMHICFGGSEIFMKFEEISGQWRLQSKTECGKITGISRIAGVLGRGSNITAEVRFSFPGDSEGQEVQTDVKVSSTRMELGDERIIQWYCPSRANPPRRVILYGGCMPGGNIPQ
jgi:hypothetical protein